MSSFIDKIFSHRIILEGTASLTDGDKDTALISTDQMNEQSTSKKSIPSTWTGLLEEGCIKIYGESPKVIEIPQNYEGDLHGAQILVGGWSGSGYSKNKISAKHLAAREVLLQIIAAGLHLKFGIPGSSSEDATDFISKMMPEMQDEELRNAIYGNYIGKLSEICARRRFAQTEYIYEENGSPNNRIFKCEATLKELDLAASAESKKKKDSKNIAAFRLYKELCVKLNLDEDLRGANIPHSESRESSKSSNSDNPYELTLPSEGALEASGNGPISFEDLIQNPDAVVHFLESRVNDPDKTFGCEVLFIKLLTIQDPKINKVFGDAEIEWCGTCSDGTNGEKVQIYLKITSRSDVPSKDKEGKEIRQTNVFGGQGLTEQEARDHACWQAMQYLYFFGDFIADPIENGMEMTK